VDLAAALMNIAAIVAEQSTRGPTFSNFGNARFQHLSLQCCEALLMGLLHLLETSKLLPGSACVNAHCLQLGHKLALLFNAPALFGDEPRHRREYPPHYLRVNEFQPSSPEHNHFGSLHYVNKICRFLGCSLSQKKRLPAGSIAIGPRMSIAALGISKHCNDAATNAARRQGAAAH
jgi:hypothetical protein